MQYRLLCALTNVIHINELYLKLLQGYEQRFLQLYASYKYIIRKSRESETAGEFKLLCALFKHEGDFRSYAKTYLQLNASFIDTMCTSHFILHFFLWVIHTTYTRTTSIVQKQNTYSSVGTTQPFVLVIPPLKSLCITNL